MDLTVSPGPLPDDVCAEQGITALKLTSWRIIRCADEQFKCKQIGHG
jgi:hypothetical protein